MWGSLDQNWDCCWADPQALNVGLLYKNKKERGLAGARPLPLRCLSQFLPERKDRLLKRANVSAYLSPMGWPGIYSICFSQLDGDKDSFPLNGVFSAFIAIGLLRDNEEAVIENYPSSLIGEIQLHLLDKLLLRIIPFPLLVRFGLIYRTWLFSLSMLSVLGRTNWASFLGRCQGPGRFIGLAFSLGLLRGLRAYFQTLSVAP